MPFEELRRRRQVQQIEADNKKQTDAQREKEQFETVAETLRADHLRLINLYVRSGNSIHTVLTQFMEAVEAHGYDLVFYYGGKILLPGQRKLVKLSSSPMIDQKKRIEALGLNREKFNDLVSYLQNNSRRKIDELVIPKHRRIIGADYGTGYEILLDYISFGIVRERISLFQPGDDQSGGYETRGISVEMRASGINVNGTRVSNSKELVESIEAEELEQEYRSV